MLCIPSIIYITYNMTLLLYRLITQWNKEKNQILYRIVTTLIIVIFLQFLCNKGYYKLPMAIVMLPFILMIFGYGFALIFFRKQFQNLSLFERIAKISYN